MFGERSAYQWNELKVIVGMRSSHVYIKPRQAGMSVIKFDQTYRGLDNFMQFAKFTAPTITHIEPLRYTVVESV